MHRSVILGRVRGAVVGMVMACCTFSAHAGETSVYLKTGWFSWEEKVDGAPFVKENGVIYTAGGARKDLVSAIGIAELLEVWGGSLDYDGHDVTGTTVIKSDTVYLGTREEMQFSVPLPAGKMSLEPLVAVGHKFWVRTRSSEDWNSFYLKWGMLAERQVGEEGKLFVKAGGLIPFYTRSHADLSGAGFTDVVTEPRGEVSAFAEGGMKFGDFTMSIDYEGMNFGASSKVSVSRVATAATGVAVANSTAYQPDSSSSFISFKLTYSF